MIEVQGLDRPRTLAAADAILAAQLRLDADQLAVAAHWADLHHPDSLPPASTAFEQQRRRFEGSYAVQPGGEGTPTVLASCPAELGLVLQTSPAGARHLIADALDLRHRLPRLWADVQAGRVRGWKARKVAAATRHLPHGLMGDVDGALAGLLPALPWSRFEAVLEATVQRADPVGAAHAEADAASRRYVGLGRDRSRGLLTVIARGEVLDILTFLAAVNRVADLLAIEGDGDTVEVRRSKAVGLLGQPDRTLALLRAHAADADTWAGSAQPDQEAGPVQRRRPATQHEHEPESKPDSGLDPDAEDVDRSTAAPACHPSAHPDREPDVELPEPTEPGTRSIDLEAAGDASSGAGPAAASIRVQLYVHLTDAALAGTDPTAVARVEGVGPVTTSTVRRWLARPDARITVRPVTVPGEATPVDGYEIPHAVREAVLLRGPATAYPWGSSTERRHLQIDHIRPYRQLDRGGAPAQTDPRLLAPLTGPEHQNKTHRRWSTRSPAPGVHLWRSPHGWVSLVTNQGTFPLGTTAAAQRIWRAAAPVSDLVAAA